MCIISLARGKTVPEGCGDLRRMVDAAMAQKVERILGKDEVTGSTPVSSSTPAFPVNAGVFLSNKTARVLPLPETMRRSTVGSYSVSGRALVDEKGRERIFNGINMVRKGRDPEKEGLAAIVPTQWNEDLIRKLSAKGINLIRLGLIWEFVEPQPGVYNEAYLDFYSDFMDLCAKYGIDCYLDMHQDLYGSYDLPWSGDGAPKWAYLSGGKAPKKPKFVWAEGYFFPGACHTAFDNFWNNARVEGKGLQDYFCDMWAHVAARFQEKPNLFGFDVFNEPFPGSAGGKAFRRLVGGIVSTVLGNKRVNKPELIKELLDSDRRGDLINVLNDPEVYHSIISKAAPIIKEFDTQYYYPFFRKVASAIRAVTKRGIIMMENCYYSNLGISCSTPRLIYRDGSAEPNLVFSPHGYDLMVDTPAYNDASNERVDFIFDEHERTQDRLDVPVVVGEWGGFYSDEGSNYSHLIHLLHKFDRNVWSQTYWCYIDGIEDSDIFSYLSRPYPRAIAGHIVSFETNWDQRRFTLHFTADAASVKKNEIYMPEKPVEITGCSKHSVKELPDGGYLVTCSAEIGENRIEIKY